MQTLRLDALRRAIVLGFAFAFTWLSPSTLEAQRTEGRNFSIAYEPGGPTRNGYMDAQVHVTYYFGACADRVVFLAHYNATPHMLVGDHRYWVDGRQVEVPPHIAPPRIERPTIRGTVRGPNTAMDINYVHASSGTPSCLTNDHSIGQTSQYWPAGTPEDRRLGILQSFGFDYRGTLPPLRNSAVESHFRQIFAQERTDSLNRARAAEQQRLQARTDSVNRARAAQAQRDSIARAEQQRRAASTSGSGGGAAGAVAGGAASSTAGSSGGSGAGSSAGSSSGGQRQPTTEEREAAAREAARQEAEADAEHARAVASHAAEQRRQREEYERQLASDIEAATVATVNLVGSIMEARRASAERKRERALREAEARTARYVAYLAEAAARFAAAPPRPTCSSADVRDSVVLGFGSTQKTLRITGDECRLASGQSAKLMTLVAPSEGAVYVTTTSSPMTSVVYLLDARTNRALYVGTGGITLSHLDAGRYVLLVTSSVPGEVGEISLSARKAWVSDAQGHLGFASAPSQPISGFVGTNQTSSTFVDHRLGLQHRRGWPYLTLNFMYATDVEASEGAVDVGVRQYIGPRAAKWQPFVEASLGWRVISVLEEPFTTISPTYGAGVNYRFSDGYGVMLSAIRITGKAKNTDDIWTSTPPDVPLDRTQIRFGLVIY
jgi:hypothetical protein